MTEELSKDLLTVVARQAAPALLAEALDEAHAEVKTILRERLTEALLSETGRIGLRADGVKFQGVVTTDVAEAGRQLSHIRTPATGIVEEVAVPGGREGRRPELSLQSRVEDIKSSAAGVYVYGFISGDGEVVSGLPGVEGSTTYPLTAGGYSAIASDMSAQHDQWGTGANGQPDFALLATRLAEHERVLEAALHHGSVLPVRFGSLYTSREGVRQVVSTHASAIGAVLARLEGKAEWGLTVTCDQRSKGDEQPTGPSVDDSTASEPSAPGGFTAGRTYLMRRGLEQAEAERTAMRRSRTAADLHHAISAVAPAGVLHALPRRTAADEPRILLRASYLVDRVEEKRFEHAIVDALTADGDLNLQGDLTGPCPPYNFSEIGLEGSLA